MRAFLLVIAALSFSACQSTQKFQQQHCQYDGAYEQGANDAKNGKDLEGEALVARCPEQTHADVRKGYKEGYESYSAKNRSFVDIIKDKVKGIADDKPKTCMQGNDEQVCGYGCIENKGEVKCAKEPNHACMASAGKIYCGLNCRETRPGKVSCDEKETL